MKRSHHIIALGVAAALCTGIMLDGTFGWRSISQKAVNETVYQISPGGRLHDDFDGSDKDIYAENYMTKNEGGVPLYVRIRLDEYMEVGAEAGENRQSATRKAIPVIVGTDINDVTTWVTHIPKEEDVTACTDSGAEAKGQETLEVQRGEILQLQSYVTCMDRIIEEQQVTWSVRGAASPNTKISADGVLSIGADEPAEVVKVTASDGKKVSGERFIKVIP